MIYSYICVLLLSGQITKRDHWLVVLVHCPCPLSNLHPLYTHHGHSRTLSRGSPIDQASISLIKLETRGEKSRNKGDGRQREWGKKWRKKKAVCAETRRTCCSEKNGGGERGELFWQREVLKTAAALQKHDTQHPGSTKEQLTKPTGNFTIWFWSSSGF